ncbi:hypothetical protein BDN71DRAFT_1455624 [Pleurotus eryngii]|uniref:Uncharacterized protein n=1 Tax=Pleurotus eryngii TaxID=5323 RepID=A0A9P6D3K4_PLEER|nr:hypothetical protein BDN71DRAFT_1455624 [Pleurotus eryngii]
MSSQCSCASSTHHVHTYIFDRAWQYHHFLVLSLHHHDLQFALNPPHHSRPSTASRFVLPPHDNGGRLSPISRALPYLFCVTNVTIIMIPDIGRISPSSPPSPPLSLSTTSTLISTPPTKLLGEARRTALLNSLDSSDRGIMKARGNLEPHITNIPRRRKKNMSAGLQTLSEAVVPDFPSRPEITAQPPESEARQDEAQGETATAPLGLRRDPLRQADMAQALTNLPRRRRKALTSEQLTIQRAFRRCLQEIGDDSGVFVAFTEVDDEEEQATRKLRLLGGEDFSYVVKVCTANETKIRKEDERTLWLYVPSDICYDDGNTHLDEQQLRVACRFLGLQGSKEKVLITTPRDRAADGMSLAVLYLAISRRFVPPPIAFLEPTATSIIGPHTSYMLSRTSSTSSTISQYSEAGSQIHSLLVYLHDQSCDDVEEAYGHILHAVGRSRSGRSGISGWKIGSGLRIEWRGTLSREGIDFLDNVLHVLLSEQQAI